MFKRLRYNMLAAEAAVNTETCFKIYFDESGGGQFQLKQNRPMVADKGAQNLTIGDFVALRHEEEIDSVGRENRGKSPGFFLGEKLIVQAF